MSTGYALLLSLGVCGVAAALEGVCAGNKVKSFFASVRLPAHSPPLWAWSIIGIFYYLIFCFIFFRLLTVNGSLRSLAIVLILTMMIINAVTNYLIFRAGNLRLSFIVGALFPVLDIALFVLLVQLDTLAACSLIPYLLYRIYAVWWGYTLWKQNESAT
jgi:tryptophan-rich sensory protein